MLEQKNTPFYVRRRRNPCGYGGDGGPECDPCKWKKTKNEYFSTQKKKNLCVCSRDRTMIDDANQLISLLTIQ